MSDYPTIERIANTPLNEHFGYQGPELVREAVALWRAFSEGQSAIKAMEDRKDAAYEERNRVVAALAWFAIWAGWKAGIARTAIEGWSEDWHGCVYIDFPNGQASWHYHDSHAHLFANLPPYAGYWDGHTTPEKYERVAELCDVLAAGKPSENAIGPIEPVARWMTAHGYATGHGDTLDDLLHHLVREAKERNGHSQGISVEPTRVAGKCSTCKGEGALFRSGPGFASSRTCPTCHGTRICHAEGQVKRHLPECMFTEVGNAPCICPAQVKP